MIREHRYIVIKRKDALIGLTRAEIDILNVLLNKIEAHRAALQKEPLRCVVVEHDWPEYETVWKMIEARVENEKWS